MSTFERIAILGSGAWGTTIANMLAVDTQCQVRLWCRRPEKAARLQAERENPLLPGVAISPRVEITAEIARAAGDADLIVVAVPTVYLRQTLEAIAPALPDEAPLLSLAKGLERKTFLRPSEIISDVLGNSQVAVLSGPNHAEEISRGLPTSSVVAAEDLDLARDIQMRFNSDRFRVYTNLDIVGVELAGGLKNVIAIAAGVSDGMGFGDNAKAALLTRGLVEMTRFGVAHGASPHTFTGLAGVGDLIATCISPHGRNRRVGMRLGQGEPIEQILGSMEMVAEGVFTTAGVWQRAQAMGVVMPITEAVYRILYDGKDPRDAVVELMRRAPKSEI